MVCLTRQYQFFKEYLQRILLGPFLSILNRIYLIRRILSGTLINVNLGHSTLIYLALLKVQSCKLYNNKYMIASAQITNTKILTHRCSSF